MAAAGSDAKSRNAPAPGADAPAAAPAAAAAVAAAAPVEDLLSNPFISYARKDKPFVKNLYDALSTDSRALWIDWEDTAPTNEWWPEVYDGIRRSDSFILVLSPDSLKSDACNKEVDEAVRCCKRIVPVVCRDVDYRDVRKEIAAINWIFFREDGDDFAAAMKLLLKALDTDVSHARAHTQISRHAREWDEKNRPSANLYRGVQLAGAKQWFAAAAMGKDPKATPLAAAFLAASDEAAFTYAAAGGAAVAALTAADAKTAPAKDASAAEKTLGEREQKLATELKALTAAVAAKAAELAAVQAQVAAETAKRIASYDE